MKINNKGKGALIAAITAAATLLSCGLAAASASAAGVDYLPAIGPVPTYTKFQPTADPGKNASDYFQPYWYAKNANDNGGTHIQAHGGQHRFQCCRHRWRCRSAGRCRGCIVHAAQACIAPSRSNG